MMDESLARRDGESNKWHERFLIYLRLGPERSLHAAYVAFRRQRDEALTSRLSVPKAWRTAFDKFEWQPRAEAHDKAERDAATAAYEKRRKEIVESGYALDFERIASLKDVAVLLLGEIQDYAKRWLKDVKSIGSGDKQERVDLERFNAPLVEQFRGLLDDIAKEKNERKPQLKVEADVTHIEITSDQMAEARRKASEYEQKQFGDSDSTGTPADPADQE